MVFLKKKLSSKAGNKKNFFGFSPVGRKKSRKESGILPEVRHIVNLFDAGKLREAMDAFIALRGEEQIEQEASRFFIWELGSDQFEAATAVADPQTLGLLRKLKNGSRLGWLIGPSCVTLADGEIGFDRMGVLVTSIAHQELRKKKAPGQFVAIDDEHDLLRNS